MKGFFILGLFMFSFVFGGEEEDLLKSWRAYQNDMPKAETDSIKFMKRVGKTYEMLNEETGSFTPSAGDLKKGYTIFTRHYNAYVYPNTLPKKEELTTKLKCFAAPGEFEPVMFFVYPHTDIKTITVSCEGLKTSENALITKENIKITYLKYDMEGDFATMICRSKWLLPGECNALKEIPRPFLITVRVPEDAAGGIYSGKVVLLLDGVKEELELSVEVLPFKLAEFGPQNLFTFYNYFRYTPEYLEKMCVDQKEHGATYFHAFGSDLYTLKFTGGEVAVDFAGADKLVPVMKKYGFKTILIEITAIQNIFVDNLKCGFYDETFNKAYKSFLGQLKAKFEKEKWPDFYLYIDEMRDHDFDNQRPLARAYKDIELTSKMHREAGVKSLPISMQDTGGKRIDDPAKDANYWELIPFVDGIMTHGWMKSARIIEEALKQKKMLLFYNCGMARFPMGYLTYILGATGNSQVSYNGPNKVSTLSPYKSNTEGIVAVAPEGPVATLRYEWMREGIDDYRYLHTLLELLEQAGDKCPAETAEAQKILDELKQFKPKAGEISGAAFEVLSEEEKRLFTGEKMDAYRLKVAKSIIAIKAKLN